MPEFYKKKLGNGLTVLFEKRNLPIVSCSASVNWGALFEREKIKGISHFMEHLMFKGTRTRSQEEIAREIEKKGGILNAYTSEEVTSYWAKLPSKYFDSGLNIVSDLILNPRFDKIEFEREKNVIIEEIKMYHDTPRFYVVDKIKEMLYKKPFGMSVAGKEEIIKKVSLNDVKKLFNSVYTTDSMMLSVVGDADFGEVCKIGEKVFPIRKRKISEILPVPVNFERQEIRKGIDQAHFMFGFHTPNLKDKTRYLYEVLGTYLFEGMSSKLFQEIREKRGLVYTIKGDFDMGSKYGYCSIYAGTKKESIREIKEIILREVKNLKNLNQREVDEVKEQLIGMKKVEEEDSSSAMNSLLIEEIGGDAGEYYKYDENILAVKLKDVKNFKLYGYSTFSLVPE